MKKKLAVPRSIVGKLNAVAIEFEVRHALRARRERLERIVDLTLEAVEGGLEAIRSSRCERCKGLGTLSGKAPDAKGPECPECKGAGLLTEGAHMTRIGFVDKAVGILHAASETAAAAGQDGKTLYIEEIQRRVALLKTRGVE